MNTKLSRGCLVALSIGLIFGCTRNFSDATPDSIVARSEVAPATGTTWLQDGLLAISRPVPAASQGGTLISTTAPDSAMNSLLGFVPGAQLPTGFWLTIDRASNSVTLMNGAESTSHFSGEGFTQVAPGTYQLMHKQRNPLWYAPDSYFKARLLPLPAEGDRSRFRRGALGEFVLFVDKDTPIHSGPFGSEEIGGIRLEEDDISRLYYQLELGATIRVE